MRTQPTITRNGLWGRAQHDVIDTETVGWDQYGADTIHITRCGKRLFYGDDARADHSCSRCWEARKETVDLLYRAADRLLDAAADMPKGDPERDAYVAEVLSLNREAYAVHHNADDAAGLRTYRRV